MAQTIALVDDDRNILTSISIALEREGFKVQTYIDGESALVLTCSSGGGGRLLTRYHLYHADPIRLADFDPFVPVSSGFPRGLISSCSLRGFQY